ncbi:MAG: TlpA family protein disulfide reductase [Bacteroidetes bacterium]|nr:MAG: TlpA family protein disulfide reductase [Bacteroidota bacterium]
MRTIITSLLVVGSFLSAVAQTEVADIKLPNEKNRVTSISELRGKVVLIDFWASWCGPCIRSFPKVKALYDTYKSKGFEVVGVSVDDNQKAWLKAIAENQLPWKHMIDAKGEVASKWDINFIPQTFLLNKKGELIGKNLSHTDLEQAINQALTN